MIQVVEVLEVLEVRYTDLLNDIAADSREIDQLAAFGARVEIREISLKLNEIVSKLESFHALHSSSLLDTNQRLSDLQFPQIMDHISSGNIGDPHVAYRFNQSFQKRHRGNRVFETTNNFWNSPKLNVWSTVPESRVVVLSGGFRARLAMRRFSVNMIQQLQSKQFPVLWALPGPRNDSDVANVSAVDIFKHLIFQALKLDQGAATEKGMSLQCAKFQRATTEQDWLQLLGSALSAVRSHVYVVIDLSMLDRNLLPTDGFSWLSAFQVLFAEIAKRCPNLQVKVLLLGDGVGHLVQNPGSSPMDIFIPVRVDQVPVRRQKQIQHTQRGHYNTGLF